MIRVVDRLACIETISSFKHASMVDAELAKLNRKDPLPIFVQVNTSSEVQKGGLSSDDAVELASRIDVELPNIAFAGFMTIGSYDNSKATLENPDFQTLIETRTKLLAKNKKFTNEIVELSMGMSTDFVEAIRAGSTNVRIGSLIFGSR